VCHILPGLFAFMAISRIKRIRFELQWTQKQLAQKLGVHQAHLSRVERGVFPLTEKNAEKLNELIKHRSEELNG
jgi:transcriptional regulator with XRE-family HTH domain